MPRAAVTALAAAAALAAAGCGTSACQELGEKLCSCQPGMTTDTCKSQVQTQLNDLGVDTVGFSATLDRIQAGEPTRYEDYCRQRLDECTAMQEQAGATDFCEFLLTETGKAACGLTPANPPPTR